MVARLCEPRARCTSPRRDTAGGRLDRRSISCSNKAALQPHSRGTPGELSALGHDLLLYEVTNASFEGWPGPFARPVPSRPRSPDRRQSGVPGAGRATAKTYPTTRGRGARRPGPVLLRPRIMASRRRRARWAWGRASHQRLKALATPPWGLGGRSEPPRPTSSGDRRAMRAAGGAQGPASGRPRLHDAHQVARGSRASRRRSPTRLMARTVSRMARPGRVGSHQATVTKSRPSEIIWPQVG